MITENEMNISSGASVEEVIQKIGQFCEKGWLEFPLPIYKGKEEYFICSGDCQSCGVPELVRLLKAMLEDKKEETNHHYPDVVYGF
ncbi:hypothetical protein KAT51_00515 [bacterium]|nr:hypothetical protein [bacterium]